MTAENSRGDDDVVDPDALAEEQAAAAAAEAAQIGGPAPADGLDPAERPVVEGGGGVAEGFEQAEEELIRQATHEGEGAPPTNDLSRAVEDGRANTVYGDADEIEATEVVRDPLEEEDDDPGAGPGITAER